MESLRSLYFIKQIVDKKVRKVGNKMYEIEQGSVVKMRS